MYRCRTCQATESASNNCVFRNTLGGSTGETAGVTTDVGSDPTVRLPGMQQNLNLFNHLKWEGVLMSG